MYERRHHPLISRRAFLHRLARHAGVVALLLAGSLAAGMSGYAAFENLGWIDAFVNASMILGGMGPVDLPKTDAGKLFAGTYALYAGLVFIVSAGVLFVPVLHRLMHRFHLEEGETPHPAKAPPAKPTKARRR